MVAIAAHQWYAEHLGWMYVEVPTVLPQLISRAHLLLLTPWPPSRSRDRIDEHQADLSAPTCSRSRPNEAVTPVSPLLLLTPLVLNKQIVRLQDAASHARSCLSLQQEAQLSGLAPRQRVRVSVVYGAPWLTFIPNGVPVTPHSLQVA